MAFQPPIPIAKALAHVERNEYVLPAIQREFVWRPGQVTSLFDSLMRGYPIGTFLFWQVAPERVRDFKFYKFLDSYHQRKRRHNDPHEPVGSQGVTAVLDGQQRLTALNIGLRGSYAWKRKYYRVNSPWAYPERRLYLDVMRPAGTETGVDLSYDFRFLTKEQAVNEDPERHWFLVKDALDWPDLQGVMDYLSDHAALWESKYARHCLSKLQQIVHVNPVVSAYKEDDQDIDKVLNIFIRVNSGGTVLSYSDLLLSMATAQFTSVDARKEIYDCVDGFRKIGRGFDFNKDLVLKACLVLSDAPDIGFKVRNFTRDNLLRIEKQWPTIRGALYAAARVLSRLGYDSHTLTARSALIPIAYYVFRRGLSEKDIESVGFQDDCQEIAQWVRRALLKRGTFGAGLDTTLRAARTTIRDKCSNHFSFAAMDAAFASIGRPLRFVEEELDDLLDGRYGGGVAFSVLTLLYPDVDLTNKFDVDHVFPQAAFWVNRLRADGVAEQDFGACRERRDRVANLQLLPESENRAKSDKMPAKWVQDMNKSREWLERSYTGEIPRGMDGFVAWYEARRETMKKRLAEILGVELGNQGMVAE